jgi:hypothetical protein
VEKNQSNSQTGNSSDAKTAASSTPSKPESVSAQSKVSKATDSNMPLLPGESQDLYLKSFNATILELGANTELQIYIAEKIFSSIWWIRRYENQKRALIIKGMVDAYLGSNGQTELRVKLTNLFHASIFDSEGIKRLLAASGQTPQSLLEESMRKNAEKLQALDEQIALRTKTMVTLQQSYEALVNRSVLRERLNLQNEILKRDLQAIDLKLAPQLEDSNDKSTLSVFKWFETNGLVS